MATASSGTHQILRHIQQIIVDERIVHRDVPMLEAKTQLIDELGLDSVSMLELVTSIEDKFDITINFEELDIEVLNVAGSLAALIQSKLPQC
jgi:acyl carrier protein